ncbi:MAG TPA: hypothetical protein VN704_11660 [Verrucomicrobiae bacterium]|nr:hypothetical protein [Verrucomicrobiae bacterium]
MKSKDVKRQYPTMLSRFLKFINMYGESIEEQCVSLCEFASSIDNRKALESELMRYIHFHENRIAQKEISSGTLRNYIKAIKLFFVMNDILVNWDKIKMGMSAVNQTSDDRTPEISEINALLDYNDIRIKPIVLTMLSSGIRVGAWDWLKWKHIIPIEKQGTIVAAKIIVYAGEPEQYFSFITLEAYLALKNYMDFRQLHGEKISSESWLVRDQWQKISKNHGHRIGLAGLPKRLNAEGIRRLIYDAWKIKGVIVAHDAQSEEKHHPFKSSHGFRKFFQTQCEMMIKSEDVEILMGHGNSRRGLKANYYRPKENHLLEQYLKVSDLLTISGEHKLKKEVKDLTKKNNEKEFLLNVAMMQKDKEVEDLRKQDKIKEEALVRLSDQVMMLMRDMQQIKSVSNLQK